MRARNLDDFRAAMRNWGAPAENQVYADTSGKIAWVPGGLVPRRSGYDGLMPVPGDGRYEWNGFVTGDELPYSVDPAQGFLASANQYNLPPGAPAVGYEWANPARYQRIVDVLSRTPRGSIASSVALQNDQFEQPAARLIPLLGSLSSADPGVQAALTLLRGWNKVSDAGSGPAALYHVWVSRHLLPAYAKAVLPPAAQPIIPAADLEVALDGLEGGLDPSTRDNLLLTTLGAAYQETQRLLGTDSAKWRWGTLHQVTFTHPLGKNVGPFARGGSANTVDAAGFGGASFAQTSGASFRMVLDVGGWDNSQVVNTPGQSGDPASPHYRDLVDKWYAGQTFPLLYSKSAINRNAEQRIALNPA
jgi:penicillin amidase